jgi:hypothetical protein
MTLHVVREESTTLLEAHHLRRHEVEEVSEAGTLSPEIHVTTDFMTVETVIIPASA